MGLREEASTTIRPVVLGLLTFVLFTVVETVVFLAMVLTGLIGLIQHSNDMIKSAAAFALCFVIIPFVCQNIMDFITGDDYEETRR